ncbi:MAG: RNA-binding S4 domain-containing protein [Bacteroidetes bacterium]|nr:RNA-binding S4 domain-containing protein [Bacteroidota bacterium]
MITFPITEEYIELCRLLKATDLCASGGEAKFVIADGYVTVNGVIETRKRYKTRPDDLVEFQNQTIKVIKQ